MNQLIHQDKKNIWHPFTQEKTAADNILIQKAKGAYVYDENNKSYLDLISSWWVNLHGHAEPTISKAIYDQANNLEHIIFAGFTHPPAIELCQTLVEHTPNNLQKCFFSDNGSTAVEVAIKMAYQYWSNQGQSNRKYFISFEGGYHGDTFGAMSVSNDSGFHDVFSPLFFKVFNINYPWTFQDDLTIDQKEQQILNELDAILEQHHQDITAIILEPLVQGAAGMRMCRASFVNQIIDRIKSREILVIYDEVMTGFYRTGQLFALEHLKHSPDFLCMSKGITGGFLPLSITMTSQAIYDCFLADEFKFAFAHGHSYTANPLACAAANASFKLLTNQQTQDSIQTIQSSHTEGLEYLKDSCKHLKHFRQQGTISACTLDHEDNLNLKLKQIFFDNGLLIRPLGHEIYLLPPYCVTKSELEYTYQKISELINQLMA